MNNILIYLLLMLYLVTSCSKNRESYMDVDFTSATESALLKAVPSSISTNKNIAVDNTLPFQTQLNGSKVFSIITNPLNGQVILVNASTGEYIYTPNNNYIGTDSFTWKIVQNGREASSVVDIIVTSSGNRAPQTVVENYTTQEDVQLLDSIQMSDSDSDPLTLTVINQTQNGIISVNSSTGTFTYQPNLNFNGTDSFSYTVSDGFLTIGPFTSNIIVTPVADAPVALNNNYSINKNASFNGQVLATDTDSTNLTYSIVSSTNKGQLFFNPNGTFNYQPNLNYTGTDSFTFRANDGNLNSNIATVTINISSINPPPPVNNPPLANNLNISTNEDVSTSVVLTGTDPENFTLSYTLLSSPTKGFISGSGASRTYTPFPNVIGSDSFTYKVNDGQLDSNIATVTITINPINDAPIAFNQNLSTNSNQSINGQTIATDIDSTNLTHSLVSNPTKGTITFSSNGGFVYQPSQSASGVDIFTFKVNDGQLDSNIATVTININSVNIAPVANNKQITIQEDALLNSVVTGSDANSDTLSFILISNTSSGSLNLQSNGLFSYQPNLNFNGTDTFTFKVNDGQLDSNIATVTINAVSVNDAPIVSNLNIQLPENQSITNNLIASDVDSASLTYSIVTQTTSGAISMNAATGQFTYTPNLNFNGTDSFTYKANDGQIDSNVATVTITVTPINSAPIANNLTKSIPEDTILSSSVVVTDPDSTTLTYSMVSQANNGVVSLNPVSGEFTYTPNLNFNGTDSFTYKANDGQLDSNVATVTVTVTPVNDAPLAFNSSFSVNQNQSYTGSLIATDVDSTQLSYSIVSQPTKGTLSLSALTGQFTYSANSSVTGSDSFTFKVNDGQLDSNVATVTVNLNLLNIAPIATNLTLITNEDIVLSNNLLGSDINGDVITYSIVSQTQNGTATVNSQTGAFSYQPNSNFNGTDSFTYKVNDGLLDSNISTVLISILPINDPPISTSNTFAINKNSQLTNVLNASDVDSSVLFFSIVSSPQFGSISLNPFNGQFTYVPNNNYVGADSFTYKVNDGLLDSNISTITINVNPINLAPIANNLTKSIPEDTDLNSSVVVTDPDSTTLIYSVVSQSTNGTISINSSNGQFTYTPNLNFNGTDSFTYKANDGQLDSNIATVTINVTPVNDAPLAFNSSFSVNQNQSYNGQLIATDVDSTQLSYSIVSQPTKGTLSLSALTGQFTYSANSSVTGSDSFTFKVNDGQLDSNVATVTVNLNSINIAPIATNLTLITNEDIVLSNNLLGSDINGDVLTYAVIAQPTSGVVSVNSQTGQFTYTPSLNFSGSDSFTYKVNDGLLDSNVATVSISVIPVNDKPNAISNTFAINKNSQLINILTANDIDSTILVFSIVSSPQFGSVSLNPFNGQFTYIPNNNYAGSDSFTFKVNDGLLDSNIATISINVNQFNNIPVANNQSFAINEDTTYNGSLTGLDIDNDILSFSALSQPTKGTLTLNTNGSFAYTPTENATGMDSFTFKVNDGQVDSNIATVSITINPINDAPIANNASFTIQEDTTLSQLVSATDVDSTALSFVAVSQPTKGTLTLNSNGSFVYIPAQNETGLDSFTFKVNDGLLDSNIATVNITITPVNDAPIANNQNIQNNGQYSMPITLTGSDPEGSVISFTLLSQPNNGTISGTAPNLIYTPNNNVSQIDSFTFKVNDGLADSNIATVSINFTSITEQAVSPIVECVQAKTNGTYYAFFGYNSPNPFTVSIPIGTNNSFTPAPQNRGQPTTINTGRHVKVFKVNNITNSSLSWKLSSITATANQNQISCNDLDNNTPVANNKTIAIQEDQATSITLTANDLDGDLLSYSIVSQPSNGTISGTAPNLTYNPNNNYSGTDSFTFKANDGLADSNVATINITISPVNDAPISQPNILSINKNITLSSQLVASDIDSTSLIYFVVSQTTNGVVSINSSNGQFTYIPNNNYVGSDSFTFKVNDGQLDSNIATIQITVLNTNTAPVAQNSSFSLNEDALFNGQLLASDIDGNTLSYTLISQASNGVVSINSSNGTFSYQGSQNFNGTDSFTFKVNDGLLDSNIATVSLTINQVNDAPLANNQNLTVNRNSINNAITLTGSDIENSVLSFVLVANPQNGTISGTGANRTYTPNNNYTGTDFFTFKVNDGLLDSNIATVTINVVATNDDWCNPDNQYQNKLVLNNQDHGALSNFPILVKLNSTRINYTNFLSNATDLYFYDRECNKIPHEIEQWNTTGDSFIWVRVPQLNANKNDSFIWMSYGGTNITNNQNKTAVWSNNFSGVWHLSETNSSTVKDSTSNINTLLKTGGPTQNMSGKIAKSIGFSCEPDGYIEQNESASLRITNNITLESWVYMSDCSSDDTIIEKYYNSSGKKLDYSLVMDDCRPKMRIGSKYTRFDTSLSLNKWNHIAATFNGTTNTCRIFVNGVLKKTDTGCTDDLSGLGGYKLKIGSNIDDKKMLYGRLDEVRISNSERSADWISAQYLSMNDGSISFGSRRLEPDEWNHDLMTIKTNADDGKVYKPSNTLYVSGHNGIAYQGSQSGQNIWGYYRFQLPNSIPANAIIKKVMLRLYGKNKTLNWTNKKLQIGMENSLNAQTVTNPNQVPGGTGGRTQLAPQIWGGTNLMWNVDAWNESPDLKNSMINLLLARGEMFQNNNIQLWITRPLDSNTNLIEVGSEDNSFEERNHAQLMIEWE